MGEKDKILKNGHLTKLKGFGYRKFEKLNIYIGTWEKISRICTQEWKIGKLGIYCSCKLHLLFYAT